ncbi:MAG: anti-sigma factor antagonist [Firmicutes bacterium]|nr:anti-sigma factor antagonist [Bacillota bacterium]
MQVRSRVHKNTLFISLDGELDEYTAEYTRVNLDKAMTVAQSAQIIIDLANLRFMDSTGIGVLIGRYKKMKDKNIPIYIANPSTQAERIFKMTGLYSIMPRRDGGVTYA